MKKLFLFLSFVGLTLITNAQCTVIFNFDTINGREPLGSLISDGTFLYGMTQKGGRYNQVPMSNIGNGTIFKIKPDGSDFEKLLDFAQDTDTILFTLDTNGSNPWGTLISDGTYLYGTTLSGGGPHQDGSIFKIKPDGTDYSKIFSFDNPIGVNPSGDLVSDGSFLYGMTRLGGAQNAGVVFKIDPDGSNYVKLLDFDITNGNTPVGSLIYDGNFLYGMVYGGGANYVGNICKIKTDGSGYANLLNFDNINGKNPTGNLIFDGTFLYGMTAYGGLNNGCNLGCGAIFKIKPDGSDYMKILDFDSTKGNYPYGSLMFDGTFLYGMTGYGGMNDFGTIFKIKPDGSGFEKIFDFDSINGRWPMYGSLVSDGTFLYGMTSRGGAYDIGVIFKLAYNCSAQFELIPDTTAPHYYHIVNNATGALPLKYYWTWGDGTFDTIAYPSHTYSSEGTYTICLTISDSVGCTSNFCITDSLQKSTNSIIYVEVIPSENSDINEINNNYNISVYPNPAKNNITIESIQKLTIEILNIHGQLILKQEKLKGKTNIDIAGLAKGVYILKLNSIEKTIIRKFIKE